MSLRATLYDALGLLLICGSALFFYKTMEFLAQKDYVAGVLAMIIGFVVIRVGVEVSKLALVVRRDGQDLG